MKKKKYIIILCCLIIAVNLIFIIASELTDRTVFVNSPPLESIPGIQVLEPNNPYITLQEVEPNVFTPVWNETKVILKEAKFRVKKLDFQNTRIMAKLNDKQYELTLDTGFANFFMTNNVVVIENNLKIFPLDTRDPVFAGYCIIDKIQIDDMTIANPPCLYKLNHYERKVLGRTTWKERFILMGLGIMRQFQYIMIDNNTSEVEFSMESFQSDPNEIWNKYQMSLEKDSNNTLRAMLEIPIAGEIVKVMFDTGYGEAISISEKNWKNYSGKLNIIKEKDNRSRMPHGFLNIRQMTVEKINICENYISDATISISQDDYMIGSNHFTLGVESFKNTAIVLDFENNLFWVKQ